MKKLMFLILSMALLFSGCSSYQYYAVKSDKVALKNYRTYAWLPGDRAKAGQIYDNDIAREKIIEATDQELSERGYQMEPKKPDLLIKYTAVVKDKVSSYKEPVYYQSPSYYVPRYTNYRGRRVVYYQYVRPFPVYVGSEMRKVQYDEGHIMIDLIDRKTSKVVWRGIGKGEVNNPEKAINELPKVIDNIFGKFKES